MVQEKIKIKHFQEKFYSGLVWSKKSRFSSKCENLVTLKRVSIPRLRTSGIKYFDFFCFCFAFVVVTFWTWKCTFLCLLWLWLSFSSKTYICHNTIKTYLKLVYKGAFTHAVSACVFHIALQFPNNYVG